MISIAVLIPVHNRIETTKQGINSLCQGLDFYKIHGKGKLQIHVIVVDDGSTDGTSEWISSNYREIHLLKGDGKLWWTGAINRGADYAIVTLKSDYLLLWNDDVNPDQSYFLIIEDLVENGCCFNTIVGSKIVFADAPEKIWSVGGFFNRFSGDFGMNTKNEKVRKRIIDCDWQPGMGTLVPVNSITRLGIKWDEKHFPHYHGDSDFTLRCRTNGLRIVTCLDLVLFNNTATTGITRKNDLKDVMMSFTSLRSIYNVRINFRFYSRHGLFPFSYMGMISKYFFYLGGYIKHSILRKQFK